MVLYILTTSDSFLQSTKYRRVQGDENVYTIQSALIGYRQTRAGKGHRQDKQTQPMIDDADPEVLERCMLPHPIAPESATHLTYSFCNRTHPNAPIKDKAARAQTPRDNISHVLHIYSSSSSSRIKQGEEEVDESGLPSSAEYIKLN